MAKYEEELLEGLTDAERAALEEDDGDDTTTTMESAYEETSNEEDDDGEGEADKGGADEDVGKAKADDAGAGAADAGDDGAPAGADAGAGTNEAAEDIARPAPLLIAAAPPDAEAKLAAIGEKKNTLISKFEDGDITAKEYQTELDTLAKEERSIERAVDKAQIAAEMRQQQDMNNWNDQVKAFTTTAQPEYTTSRVRWMALNEFVKEVANDPANANLTGAQILAKAHARVTDDLGEAPAAKKAKADGAPLKGSKAAPPKTLAAVPAAQGNDVGEGRWGSLDRLLDTDPIAHEEKLMKMTDSELDAYNNR